MTLKPTVAAPLASPDVACPPARLLLSPGTYRMSCPHTSVPPLLCVPSMSLSPAGPVVTSVLGDCRQVLAPTIGEVEGSVNGIQT